MSTDITATAYLQMKKDARSWRGGGKVVKSTQARPTVLQPGCILIKVKFRVPAAAFAPFERVAEVVVPAELTQHEISVVAEDTGDQS